MSPARTMGVSYKLLPMFMLAPEERGATGNCVHVLGTAGFALAVATGIVQIWIPTQLLRIAETAGDLAIVLAIMLSGVYDRSRSLPGIKDVNIEVVWDPRWSPKRMSPVVKSHFGVSE